MAHNPLQNASKCLTRAGAEIGQAARECDLVERVSEAETLRKHQSLTIQMRDKLDKAGGAGGGKPATKKIVLNVPAPAIDLSDSSPA